MSKSDEPFDEQAYDAETQVGRERFKAPMSAKEALFQMAVRLERPPFEIGEREWEEFLDRFADMSNGFTETDLEAAELIGAALRKRGLTVAVAESCTGGLLGALLTEISGSSDYVLGGVIAYSNEVKAKVLGVSRRVLEDKGAVSPEVAFLMADAVRAKLGADIGVATTGVAGPESSEGKPPGLIYLCAVGKGGGGAAEFAELKEDFGRVENRLAAVRAGLELIKRVYIKQL